MECVFEGGGVRKNCDENKKNINNIFFKIMFMVLWFFCIKYKIIFNMVFYIIFWREWLKGKNKSIYNLNLNTLLLFKLKEKNKHDNNIIFYTRKLYKER